VNQHQVPALGSLMQLFALAVLLSLDLHLVMLDALAASARLVPVGAPVDAEGGLLALVKIGGTLFVLGLRFAAPVIAAVLVANVALAALSRAAPQLNILQLAFPIQIAIGLVTLLASLPLMAAVLGDWAGTFDGMVGGVLRPVLNGKFVFQMGTLDQGYWPDGIYTAPTDAALRFDLAQQKALGFNMVRKHIKVEPARWFYHADQLGLMVWQDMPSMKTGFTPSAADRTVFEAELRRMIDQLKGIRGPDPVFHNGERILSLPDAIANVLESHLKRGQTELQLAFPAAAPEPKVGKKEQQLSMPPLTQEVNSP
jgi:hypothetical protein